MKKAVEADPRFNAYHNLGLFVFVPESVDEAEKSQILEEYFAGIDRARAAASAVIGKAALTGRFSRNIPLSFQAALLIARDELDNPVLDQFRGAFIHFLSCNNEISVDKATGVIRHKQKDPEEVRNDKRRPWLAT